MLPIELKADRDITMCAVSLNRSFILDAPIELQEDDDVVRSAIRNKPIIINQLPVRYRLDIEMINYALSSNKSLNICYENGIILLPEFKLELDRDKILRLIEANYGIFRQIPAEYFTDRDVVMSLSKFSDISTDIYRICRDLFNKDRELLEHLISNNGYVIEHIDIEFKRDRELVKIAAKSNVKCILCYLLEEFQEDREIIEIALQTNIYNYVELNDEFKSDKELVLNVLRDLKYANDRIRCRVNNSIPDHLKSDPDIAILL